MSKKQIKWADLVGKHGKDLPQRTSPDGAARYVWVNKPDTAFNDNEGTYKTDLIVPGDDAGDLQAEIDAAMEGAKAAAQAKFDEMTKAKQKKAEFKQQGSPYEPEYDDEDEETGNVVFKFKTKASGTTNEGKEWTRTLPLYDSKGKKTKAQVYPGSTLAVSFRIKPWALPTCKYGVKLEMLAVQIIELSEGGASAEAHGFATRDDGFESSGNEGATASDDDDDDEDDNGESDDGDDEEEF